MHRLVSNFLDIHAYRWSLLYPLSFVTGVAVYLTAPLEPEWITILSASFALAGILYVFTKAKLALLTFLSVHLVIFCIGLAFMKLKTEFTKVTFIEYPIGPVWVEGKLQSIEGGSNGNRLLIKVGAISDLSKKDTPSFIRVTQKTDTYLLPGRQLACLVFLSPPPSPILSGDFHFRRQAFYKQLGGVGFTLGKCKPIAWSMTAKDNVFANFQYGLDAVRHSLAIHINSKIGEKSGGMAAAMITGEKTLLSNDDQETLRSVGLAHLLAISGLHMGLAAGVFFYLIKTLLTYIEFIALRIYVSKIAAIGAICGATGYLFLSGASIATQRAYVMAVISLIAILIDRPALSLRNVCIAMTIIVLLQPETVVSPGFQMSFAATAALIALYEIWPRAKRRSLGTRTASWASSILATSFIASLATAPFSAFHFGRVAPMSVISNLAAMPIISLWSAPSAALAAIVTPLGLENLFLKSFGYSLEVILIISRYFQTISPDGGMLNIPTYVFLLLTISLLAGVFLVKWYKILALAPLGFAVIVFVNLSQPIMMIDKSGIVYVNTQHDWIRVLPHNLKSKPLKPLSLKDHLTDHTQKYGTLETLSQTTGWGKWEVSNQPCHLNDYISSNYIRIAISTDMLCLPLTEQAFSAGVKIFRTSNKLVSKTFGQSFNANRYWSN